MARSVGRAPTSSLGLGKPKPKSSKFQGKKAQANAAGYLKRKANAAPKKSQIDNVYEEYEGEDRRRGKGGKEKGGRKARKEMKELEYDFGEDGYVERNSDDDEEEAGDGRGRQPRLFGEGDEIGSSEDEEIDSDAAFEDDDGVGEGFGGVFARKKQPAKKKAKKPAVRFADVDLDEDDDGASPAPALDSELHSDEEEDEDLDSDVYIDMLDVLDGKGQVWNGEDDSDADSETAPKPKAAPKPIPFRKPAPASDEGASASEDDDEGNEEESGSDEDDDELAMDIDTSPEALTALHNLISSLPSDAPPAKRKAADDGDANPKPRKKRAVQLKERTQAGAEGEFAVGSSAASAKLTLDDLLAPLASGSGSGMDDVRQGLTEGGSKKGKKKSTGLGLLAAPLPTRMQDRVDRAAAYEATREEVKKWEATMKHIREAEHLSFPLQDPTQPVGRVSNAELTAKFTPTTELETTVSRLLSAANMARESDIQHTENALLAQSELTPEEVMQRRNELRMMRELAFRAEIKARRVGKIKSKAFRKIARGKKKRETAAGQEDDSGEDDEKRMQREVERAKARAGLKVKRSAKLEKARAGAEGGFRDDDGDGEPFVNDAVRELERGEQLKRLIRGEDEEQNSDDDSDEDDEDQDSESIKRKALAKLAALNEDVGADATAGKKKGVFGMKFMQDAMRRRDAEVAGLVDEFESEINRVEAEGEGEDANGRNVVIQRTGGRVALRPGNPKPKASSSQVPVSDVATDGLSKSSPLPEPQPSSQAHSPSSSGPAVEDNPWLVPAASTSGPKKSKKKNTVVVSKESGLADKAAHRLGKKKANDGGAGQADEDVEVDLDRLLGGGQESTPAMSKNAKKKEKQRAKAAQVSAAEPDPLSDDGENSEVEAQEAILAAKKGTKQRTAFEQRELVARAFAGDNVVRDFAEAKQREIDADAPKEVDLTLPGWGSWGGPHASTKPSKKKFTKQIPGVLPTARADHGKANIIISHKVDKKAAKYQVKDLPYPYTSKAQYERSLDTPVGREWNTRVAFQRGTLPAVVKKMGTVIEPLRKM